MKFHFHRAPLALLAATALLSAQAAHGAVVYSGVQNITIGNTFSSVFIDVDGMTSSTTQSTGWDLEAFFGGEGIGNSASFQPTRQTVAVDAPILRLNVGDTVDSLRNYYTAAAGSSTHIGTAPQQFASGSEGYFGFVLTTNSGDGPYYGWMHVTLSNTGSTGTIIDWAFDNTGSPITVGTVPEASSAALAAFAGLALASRRHRRR